MHVVVLLLFLLLPVSHNTPTGKASLRVSGPLVVYFSGFGIVIFKVPVLTL